MSRPSLWATKVCALIQGGNAAAALLQIKVAPSVRDLEQLRSQLIALRQLDRHPQVDLATQDQIDALSAPRLHRAP